MDEEKKQVNVEMYASLVEFLDVLAQEDQSTRSGVIRKLILQEKARRDPRLNPNVRLSQLPRPNKKTKSIPVVEAA